MTDTPRILSLASATALLLALSHSGLAAAEGAITSVGPASEASAPAAPAPVEAVPQTPAAEAAPAAPPATEAPAPGPEPAASEAPATAETPAAAPTPAEAAREMAEARRAEIDAERNQRYQDLRQRAAEVGLELPETPPWEAMPQMPETPEMPGMPGMPGQAGVTPPDWEAVRKEREAMRERFKSMTPEERKAMREAHWQQMRERAAARGVEMPETPPWEEAEKRYKAAQEQFDRYRKIVDEMTEEQLEAARALFGHGEPTSQPMTPMMQPQMQPQMPPQMPSQMRKGGYGYGYGPQGGYPGYGPYQGGPGPMSRTPVPYYEGAMEQGPPPPRGALPY